MKRIINCGQVLTNLNGEPLKDQDGEEVTVGGAIANLIAAPSKKVDTFKAFEMAMRFNKATGKEEVDGSDVEIIENAAKENGNVIMGGQLRSIIKESPEVKDDTKKKESE